jgi:TolB-like protein
MSAARGIKRDRFSNRVGVPGILAGMRGALQIRLVSALLIASLPQAGAGGADVSAPPAGERATPATTRVLILPFESLSGDPVGDAAPVPALARGLADDLSAGPSITSTHGEKVAPDAEAAIGLGKADGAQFVVWGTTQTVGDRVRVAGQVLDVGSGKAAGRFKLTGTVDGWFELQDAVAEQVRRRVLAGSGGRQAKVRDGGPGGAGAADGARQPVEAPAGEPLWLRRHARGERPAWAEPPARRHEEPAHRYGAAVPYDFDAFGYWGHGWYHRRCDRPDRPWRGRFGQYRYTYDGHPRPRWDHYGPARLGRFHGPVPLRWFRRR